MRGGSSYRSRPLRRSPYAVLNLTRGRDDLPITDDRIRESYKRLSRLLHPDKRPESERGDAQEVFLEMQHAYEILEDPVLRQAYDRFGHSGVALVRHNKYSPNSLYRTLSTLHDNGESSEALEVLQIVIEDKKLEKRQKEWEFDADVQINMHAAPSGSKGLPEVSSTIVSVMASVPIPEQTAVAPFPAQNSKNEQSTQQKQRLQLSIGGKSNLEKGAGSTQGILSASYHPVKQTSMTSGVAIGYEQLETSLSTSTNLRNGTGLSANMTRQCKLGSGRPGTLAFGFSSHRRLTLVHGRTFHALFALGVGSNLEMNYGMLSLTAWGFSAGDDDKSNRTPPKLTAKLQAVSSYPIELSISQPYLFDSPRRSGEASVAYSPIHGCKIKGKLNRRISKRCKHHESEFASNLGIGVEHTGLSGFKWLISYQRPEGLTIRIPIFVSSFLSPVYWSKFIWVSTLSWLLDETIEEWIADSQSTSDIKSDYINAMLNNKREQHWLCSSEAKQNVEKHMSLVAPVAEMKRRHEELVNGLVILKAIYSPADSLPQERATNVMIDITQQLQFWVQKSQLYLPPSSKRELVGFYDINGEKNQTSEEWDVSLWDQLIIMMNGWLSRFGIRKYTTLPNINNEKTCKSSGIARTNINLTVRYKYKGQVYELIARDDDELKLPSVNATTLGFSEIVS